VLLSVSPSSGPCSILLAARGSYQCIKLIISTPLST
jgi:hypothetical protein